MDLSSQISAKRKHKVYCVKFKKLLDRSQKLVRIHLVFRLLLHPVIIWEIISNKKNIAKKYNFYLSLIMSVLIQRVTYIKRDLNN